MKSLRCWMGFHKMDLRIILASECYVFRCERCRGTFYVNDITETMCPLTDELRRVIEHNRNISLKGLDELSVLNNTL